jgi:hypothetical protein
MMKSENPPVPPFDHDVAIRKVRFAEDAWNSRDPEKVATAYTLDSVWRNRSEFLSGREQIVGTRQAPIGLPGKDGVSSGFLAITCPSWRGSYIGIKVKWHAGYPPAIVRLKAEEAVKDRRPGVRKRAGRRGKCFGSSKSIYYYLLRRHTPCILARLTDYV